MSAKPTTLTFAVLAFIALLLIPLALAQDTSLDALAKAGHWKRIRAALQQRQTFVGSDAENAHWQARVNEALGNLPEAETLARKAVALDASKAAYHDGVASICLDQLEKRPSMFRAMHLAHDTKTELETALSLDPKDLDAMWLLMEYDWHAPAIAGGSRDKANELAARISHIEPARGYLAQAQLNELANAADNSRAEGLLEKRSTPRPATTERGQRSHSSMPIPPRITLQQSRKRKLR